MTPEGRGGESRSGPPPQVRWVTPGSPTSSRTPSTVASASVDIGEGKSAELVALESPTMPEVVSFAMVVFEGTCEGKPATRDEAFDAVIAGGEVITQWYRVGDVTEQPPAAPGAGACCGPGNELGLSARMPRVLP